MSEAICPCRNYSWSPEHVALVGGPEAFAELTKAVEHPSWHHPNCAAFGINREAAQAAIRKAMSKMLKEDLPPSKVVLDLVLKYSASMPRLWHAAVLGSRLIFAVKNHRDEYVSLSTPVHFDGEPYEGDSVIPPRFVLYKLGPSVWKLSPSILHDTLHAYLTIVDVPDDVSWGKL